MGSLRASIALRHCRKQDATWIGRGIRQHAKPYETSVPLCLVRVPDSTSITVVATGSKPVRVKEGLRRVRGW